MKIRRATKDDRLALFKLAAAMHTETDFRALTLNPMKTLDSLGFWIASPNAVALLAEHDTAGPVGFLLAKITAPWYSDELAAVEDCFYVSPEHRGSRAAYSLVRAFVAWAQEFGALHARAGVSSGSGRAGERLYEHFGMKNMGGNFVVHWNKERSHVDG